MIYVYFVQVGKNGPIKIGCSIEPRKRFTDIQIYHYEDLTLLGFVEQTEIIENRLHRTLANSRIRGEWFWPTSNVVALIKELLTGTVSTVPSVPTDTTRTIPVKPLKDLEQEASRPRITTPSELEVAIDQITGDTEASRASEKMRIATAIKDADGDITVAARLLNCSRRTLQNRMRQYGLPRGRSGRPPMELTGIPEQNGGLDD